jgi:hypothetical protein
VQGNTSNIKNNKNFGTLNNKTPQLSNGQLPQKVLNNFNSNIKNFMNNQMTIMTPPNQVQSANKYQQNLLLQGNSPFQNQQVSNKVKFNEKNNNFSSSASFLMKSENKINNNLSAGNSLQSTPQIPTEVQKQFGQMQQNNNYGNFIQPTGNRFDKVGSQNQPQLTLNLNRSNSNLRGNQQITKPIPGFSSPQMTSIPNYSNLQGLEQKVESMNEKLSRLENRVEKDEKITFSARDDIKELKTNLDKNFSKLDLVLEKLAVKLK